MSTAPTPIDHPLVRRFCNERVRVAADILCRGVASARAILNEWQAKNISALIPDDPNTQIVDGMDAAGAITGADVHRVIEALNNLVTAMEGLASNNETHYGNALKVAVNPLPRIGVQL